MREEVADETRAATARRALFFRARVLVLVTVLLSVVLYAATDVRRRRARNEWDHTLEIAVVLLASRPVAPGAVAALQARVPTLEARLAAEGARYRARMPRPLRFRVSGPFVTELEAPRAAGTGVAELAQHAWATRQYTRAIDEGAGVDAGSYDARIYVRLRPPVSAKKAWVEGQSEQGGWVGQVDVELDERMVDVALAVIAHETLHTLGATDKYEADGRTLVPQGLADPAQRPLYPQRRADVMARGRLVAEGAEALIDTLDEVGVGPATALELGWTR